MSDGNLFDLLIAAREWLTETNRTAGDLYRIVEEALLSCEPEQMREALQKVQATSSGEYA